MHIKRNTFLSKLMYLLCRYVFDVSHTLDNNSYFLCHNRLCSILTHHTLHCLVRAVSIFVIRAMILPCWAFVSVQSFSLYFALYGSIYILTP